MQKRACLLFLCRIEYEVIKMAKAGRPKGGKNRRWTKEEKLRIVKRNIEDKVGQHRLAKEENVSRGILHHWIMTYLENGETGLESKKKPGNLYAALHTSKHLTEEERLRLTVAKQQVEIARLKKGYYVERGGADKVFVTLNGVSIKS